MSLAYQDLFGELRAYKRSRAFAVALSTGLLDAVSSVGLPVASIAAACLMPEDWTYSLLLILADLGLVERREDMWMLTAKGKEAASNQALRAFAGYHLHCYESWLSLPDRCRGIAAGTGFHQQAARNPAFVRAYLLSMDAIAQRSLPFLKKECRLTGTVLDVGAGPATFCRHLASSGRCRVTALDHPQMIEIAKDLFTRPASFEWLAADFRDYAPPRKFDSLFCSHLLEYASPPGLADWLGQMREFLRPGGTAAFLTFLRQAGSDASGDLNLFELSTGLNGERLGHICTADEFKAALQHAGAAGISCNALPEGPSYSEYLVTCIWS